MFAKAASLVLAAAALAGAVIYAQNQAEKGKKAKPVFDTSKSGTPTPIEEAPAPSPGVAPPAQTQANQPPKPDPKHKKQKKNGDMTIMPSSKSMTPPPKKPDEPTPPVPPT